MVYDKMYASNDAEDEVSHKSSFGAELCCKNVPGGWQTAIKKTDYLFGPVYNNIQDLWHWQRVNIYGHDDFPEAA